jgi:hypothetical protein
MKTFKAFGVQVAWVKKVARASRNSDEAAAELRKQMASMNDEIKAINAKIKDTSDPDAIHSLKQLNSTSAFANDTLARLETSNNAIRMLVANPPWQLSPSPDESFETEDTPAPDRIRTISASATRTVEHRERPSVPQLLRSSKSRVAEMPKSAFTSNHTSPARGQAERDRGRRTEVRD